VAGLVEPNPDVNLGLPIRRIYIPTDGSVPAESHVRTTVAAVLPTAIVNSDRAPIQWDFSAAFVEVAGIVGGGILAAVVFSTIALPLLALTTRHDTIRYE